MPTPTTSTIQSSETFTTAISTLKGVPSTGNAQQGVLACPMKHQARTDRAYHPHVRMHITGTGNHSQGL